MFWVGEGDDVHWLHSFVSRISNNEISMDTANSVKGCTGR